MIRQATNEDLSVLVEIGKRTFLDAFVMDNDPNDMKIYLEEAFSSEQIKREIEDPNHTFYLAYPEAGEEPLGYAKLREGKADPAVRGPVPIEIERLYVEQTAIGRGVGAALMRTCLEEAKERGCRTVWLGVWEHNRRALAFYAKWGFEPVGSHPFVVGEDEQTDLILELSLDSASAAPD